MARLARFIGFRGLTLSLLLCITLISSSSVANADTIVNFDTSHGSFQVQLYDTATPITVENFLNYVANGRYNGPFMHRLVMDPDPGIKIIQGGGYVPGPPFDYVPAYSPILNEFDPSRSNVRGTIAMAKTSDPDSATSQFFFNLGDNSTALDNPLISGGYTVFGEVIGNGMDVLDAMGALETFSFKNSSNPVTTYLTDVPLWDYTSVDLQNSVPVTADNFVTFNVTVPEPASLSLLVLGGLVMLRRRSAQVLRRRRK